MTTRPDYPLIDARTFFEMNFGDRKAELDNGILRIIDGVTALHAIIQGNLFTALRGMLRGSDHSVYSSSFPICVHDRSVRRADAVIIPRRSGKEHDDDRFADDPIIILEFTSYGASRTALPVKIPEYKAMPTLDSIFVIDVVAARSTIIQRTGPRSWNEIAHDRPVDLQLPFLGLMLAHDEIFAHD